MRLKPNSLKKIIIVIITEIITVLEHAVGDHRCKVETKHIACAKRGETCNRCQGKGKRATGAKRSKMRLRKVKILLVLLLLLDTVSEPSAFLFQVERGIRFLGQSYAAVETGQREMSSLSLTFKTLSPSGVLVYSGEVTWFLLFIFVKNLP